MNNDLNKIADKFLRKSRPRPLLYVGKVNGKACFVRKKSLTMKQFYELHPRKWCWYIRRILDRPPMKLG